MLGPNDSVLISVRRQRPVRDQPDARAVHERRARIAGLGKPPAAGGRAALRDLRTLEPDRAGVDRTTAAVITTSGGSTSGGSTRSRCRSCPGVRDQEVGKAGDVPVGQGRGGAAVPDSLNMRCLPVGGPMRSHVFAATLNSRRRLVNGHELGGRLATDSRIPTAAAASPATPCSSESCCRWCRCSTRQGANRGWRQ